MEHRPDFLEHRPDANQAGAGCEAHFTVEGPQKRDGDLLDPRNLRAGRGDARKDRRHLPSRHGAGCKRERGTLDLDVHPHGLLPGDNRERSAETALPFERRQRQAVEDLEPLPPAVGSAETRREENRE